MSIACARSWMVTCACACALFLGCKNSTDYLEVNKRNHDGGNANDGAAATDGKRDGGGGTSGARNDGGFRFDGAPTPGSGDGAAIDRDASLMLPDGAVILQDGAILLPDGDVIDLDTAIMRYGPEVDVASCEVSEDDTWHKEVAIADEGGFALVAGQTGFGLAYKAIGGNTCRETIEAMPIPSIGDFTEPHSILPDCSTIVELSLLSLQDAWLLAWVDNFTDMAELHTLTLDADMKIASGQTRTTLTNNQLLFEHRPVLQTIDGQPMVAWISEDTNNGERSISTQRLDGKAKAIEVLKGKDGQHPEGLAFAAIGADAAAVGWVGPIESPGVWLHKLDGAGAPVGEPILLTDKVAASSSIDMANRIEGGAAVYSIEIDGVPQVRFRRLDETGEPMADERTLIGPPLRAQSASLYPLGGGYAVAYRALPGGGIEQPEVRLTFITKEGNLMRDASGRLLSFHIGDATIADARTYVSRSVDGELMIAWIDGGAANTKVLKVARRRLDCR